MHTNKGTSRLCKVSLFTREWIEMERRRLVHKAGVSPSLRGSGLKLSRMIIQNWEIPSPSLRGSGLKYVYHLLLLKL